MAQSAKLFSEDELGRKWDSCLHDTVLKLGGGLVVGGIFSLLFFKPLLMVPPMKQANKSFGG